MRAWRQLRASLARRIGLDANPLRRGTDRAEAWIRIALLMVFLISAPLATAAVGRWAHAASAGSARAHAATVQQATATLVRGVPTSTANPGRASYAWAPARWSSPSGGSRTGEVQAPIGSRAGAKVTIWIDKSGKLSEPPLTSGQLLSRVVTAMALTPVVLGLLLAFCLAVVRRVMERQQLIAWEAAWSAVEPQWTRRSR